MRRGFIAPLVIASALVLGVSGCTFQSEIATQKDYDPSDGVGATMGDIALRNVMLITNNQGDANLVMSVVNTSGENVSLQVQYDAGGERITELLPVPSRPTLTRFGDDPTDSFLVTGDDVLAGSLIPLYFQYASVPGEMILVPVLHGTLLEYELLVP